MYCICDGVRRTTYVFMALFSLLHLGKYLIIKIIFIQNQVAMTGTTAAMAANGVSPIASAMPARVTSCSDEQRMLFPRPDVEVMLYP